MRMLHDRDDRERIVARVRSLRPDSARLWGTMTVDQALWHVNQGMRNGLGELRLELTPGPPMPRALFKWLALRVPWPRGARTAPAFVARGAYDFEEQRTALLNSVEVLAGRALGGPWPPHTGFGKMSGTDWSRLMHKHLDHHLRQFGA